MFRTVLCVRLECFEMTLTQRLFIHFFSKRTSVSAFVIVIVTFIISKAYQKTNRVKMTHEQIDPFAL